MAGYMIAEVWCDECLDRVQIEDQGTLREFRAQLREEGWRRRRTSEGLVDLCESCDEKRAVS